ncbi:torsin-1A isoform X2 [Octopus bimaculoides]|uniref:Torsin n=3 Tax=Octopus bimaculoides TaxID=37653 RepID=A0A0L8ICH1_OCTBM|nr:torsin-1A isoform X2 [Octopus bimaculoides]XP_014777451.1 torsin-1A isoform X2 [Octopus bimaculoides]|eukprot:XP_014777443.1 PREDICTED: torsin-1A-like isoform X1 [Octopus bimaculoides]
MKQDTSLLSPVSRISTSEILIKEFMKKMKEEKWSKKIPENKHRDSKLKRGKKAAKVKEYLEFPSRCIFAFITSFIFLFLVFYISHCHKIPAWERHSVSESLSTKIIGQDLAIHLVVESLTNYIKSLETNYPQPLVLSFHGGVGVGKTYLASLLYKYLPENTQSSIFSFSHHYKFDSAQNSGNKLLTWIYTELSPCHWNIFILDDFEDTGPAQQILTETLTHLKNSNFYKYTYALFIIITTVNSENINNIVFRKVQSGNQNKLKLTDFEHVFQKDSQNEWFFKLHKQGLIDAVVPFFPLNKTNVLECIKAELANHHHIINEDFAKEVLKEIYFNSTKGFNYEYSSSGCKKVSDKIYLRMNKTSTY